MITMYKRLIKCWLMIIIITQISLASADTLKEIILQTEENKPIDILWNCTIGGESDDLAYSVIQTADGGLLLAGITFSYGEGGSDSWLIKTNATGQVEWNRTVGGLNHEEARSVIQTADGGYVIAGMNRSSPYVGEGDSDFWLVKTNETGYHEWNQTYGGTEYDELFSMIQTNDGGFALAGRVNSYGAGQSDFWLVKTNTSGHHEWNSTFGGTETDGAYSVIQTVDGGYALAGVTNSYGDGGLWLVKTDEMGQAEWNRTIEGGKSKSAYSMVQTSDGGFAFAGWVYHSITDEYDTWLVKTNAMGYLEWEKIYVGADDKQASTLLQTPNGGFVIAGYTKSHDRGQSDVLLMKTDSTGQLEGNYTFGGNGDDVASAMNQNTDGGIVITGGTYSYGAGQSDCLLIKINTSDTPTTTDSHPSSTPIAITSSNSTTHSLSIGFTSIVLVFLIVITGSKKRNKS